VFTRVGWPRFCLRRWSKHAALLVSSNALNDKKIHSLDDKSTGPLSRVTILVGSVKIRIIISLSTGQKKSVLRACLLACLLGQRKSVQSVWAVKKKPTCKRNAKDFSVIFSVMFFTSYTAFENKLLILNNSDIPSPSPIVRKHLSFKACLRGASKNHSNQAGTTFGRRLISEVGSCSFEHKCI